MICTTPSRGRPTRSTTFRVMTLIYSIAVASAFVYAPFAPLAHADPPKQAVEKKSKPTVAAPPKPKPISVAKEPSKYDAGPPASAIAHSSPPASGRDVVERESRIEFDERMVRGQSAAGSIFLFQRAPSELKSIVEVPDSFRAATVELVQSRPETP